MEHYVNKTVTGQLHKILVVEDDLSLRQLWEYFLKSEISEAIVEWAVSCEEALKMIEQQNNNKTPYFLIITDIFLAGSKTGIELITSAEVANSKAIKILVSSTYRDEIIKKFGHMISGVTVLSKPLDFKQIKVIFKTVLKGSDRRPESSSTA